MRRDKTGTQPYRPRVLVIEAAGNLWGSERALLDLLDGMGVFERAVCCPAGRPLVEELARRNIQVLPHIMYALHLRGFLPKLLSAIGILWAGLKFRPDVIYLNQSGSYRITLLAAQLLRAPIVAHVRIFEDAKYLARQRPASALLKGLIAISSSIEDAIRAEPSLHGISVHRIFDAYALSPVQTEPAMRPRTIACVGRIVPVKGQDLLVEALGLLAEPPRCLFLGDGDPSFIVKAKSLATAPVAKMADWLGFVEDVMPVLRSCPVLVCPSLREPLGRVIFEAWDAGAVPVVYAGCGGAAEIVRAADAGILYDSQIPQSLAAALQTALDLSDGERQRIIANGRAWMEKNSDPHSYAAEIERIFSGALEGSAREAAGVCQRNVARLPQ